MVVDGKDIAARIYEETATLVRGLSPAPVLVAITCAPNFETQRYLELKKRKASEVGITLRIVELPEDVTTEEAIECVQVMALHCNGIVVQLPFPSQVDREAVLAAVPASKDPDGFSYGTEENSCLPPVVGAIVEIASIYNISFQNKKVVVLGQGRLVGAPAARFLRAAGADVHCFTEHDGDPRHALKEADVLVTGIGKPHFVTADMLKPGVVVFDAGTSEDGGVVVGDVHPEVAHTASLFTPVPGGIGPITVAILLRNLVSLVR
jgi:methylenetetrahydrofolate dehydrogenase (NADP+)/methenyltetrahydrofolate cyclohydrolase